MPKKKALIITYYWPPGGGVPVQRWVKFVKYLHDFGWEPIVYTVLNGDYTLIDLSLEAEVPKDTIVIRKPIWEPYRWYRRLAKNKKSKTQLSIKRNADSRLIDRLALWLRSNIFVPDARCFWIRPSVRFLANHLKTNKVDVIISTGPPHSLHLIGLGVSKKTGIPWVADFRDPWTSMDYYADLRLTAMADRKHHRLEREVLKNANSVIVVSRRMQHEFEEKRGGPVEYIPNGYDTEDFEQSKHGLDQEFSIVHVGTFLARRNPYSLWKAIAILRNESHPLLTRLRIKLIGQVDDVISNFLVEHGLRDLVDIVPFVPHDKAVAYLQAAQLLLLPIDKFAGAEWVVTGKLFEYLAAGRPILCVGPMNGDAAAIIGETKTGNVFGFDDVEGIKLFLIQSYERFEKNTLNLDNAEIKQYSRKDLTRRLADVLNKITA